MGAGARSVTGAAPEPLHAPDVAVDGGTVAVANGVVSSYEAVASSPSFSL